MKISGVDIRPGNILEYEKGIWKVAKIQHTQPGKGGAYMQVEMKNLQDGRKTNVRFRSADTVERVRLDTKEFQFLYAEGEDLVFMDNDTYEQITLPGDLLGDARPFLQDGMQVNLELWDEKPISVELPSQIEATIVEADAVVKGQTASSSYKPAILDNGVRIMCRRTSAAAPASSSTCTNKPTSARRAEQTHGSYFRPDPRDGTRRAQGGRAFAARFRRSRTFAGQPQGPGRFRQQGRYSRRTHAL